MQTEQLTQSKLLDVEGRRIEYRFASPDAAHGADIVMLHEGLGSVSLWRDFPERLAQATGRRVLVYSRLGYGYSSPADAPRRVDYMHEEARIWLPAILGKLGIRRPFLFGHSDGASIALIHAAESNAAVQGIIALAPHIKVEELSVQSITAVKTAYLKGELRARLSRHHADADAVFWGWNRIWLEPQFRAWNIEGLLSSIRCPVLAIQGEEDEYGTMEQIAGIARAVPRSTMLALADCRHSPHRDQPRAVLDAAREFLALHAEND